MALTVKDFLDKWRRETLVELEILVATKEALVRTIRTPEVNRPGLSLTGYFDHFNPHCIQVFGNSETGFLHKLEAENRLHLMEKLFEYPIPLCIITNNNTIPKFFEQSCRQKNIPICRTPLKSFPFVERLSQILDDEFAQQVTIHGVLVEIFGVGILLRGKSGVGKSECALELIERGHRLIADDLVSVKQTNYRTLIGRASELTPYYMEIRGLGIIDIKNLFGIRAIRELQEIELVINLDYWDENKTYDRLGINEQNFRILDVELPLIEIPVRPGRNIPIIVETAAINARAKKLGIYSARILEQRMLEFTSSNYFFKENISKEQMADDDMF